MVWQRAWLNPRLSPKSLVRVVFLLSSKDKYQWLSLSFWYFATAVSRGATSESITAKKNGVNLHHMLKTNKGDRQTKVQNLQRTRSSTEKWIKADKTWFASNQVMAKPLKWRSGSRRGRSWSRLCWRTLWFVCFILICLFKFEMMSDHLPAYCWLILIQYQP